MTLKKVDDSLSSEQISSLVFKGDILHFEQLPAMKNFCEIARSTLRKNLSGLAPLTAHRYSSQDDLLNRLSNYQKLGREDPGLSDAFRKSLKDLGFDLSGTYWDRFILRSIPPKSSNQKGTHAHVNLHRDTWGANIYQQINWWGPIYPLAQNRTIEFFLEHWNSPIKNTTKKWRFSDYLLAKQRQSEESGVDYPQVPQTLEVPEGKPFRPVIKPGDLICFSSAHLHGSVANYSGFTRYSFETRTISLSDIKAGRAAHNVDNHGKEQMKHLFSHVLTEETLSGYLPLSPLINRL